MIQSDGIIAETNAKGEIIQVTIDVQKHQELAEPALEYLRLEEKSKFQQECARAISIEEAKKLTLDLLEKSWGK